MKTLLVLLSRRIKHQPQTIKTVLKFSKITTAPNNQTVVVCGIIIIVVAVVSGKRGYGVQLYTHVQSDVSLFVKMEVGFCCFYRITGCTITLT